MDVTPGIRREPAPDLESVGEDERLVERIAAEIDREGPMTFARFMELALYDPDGGYYRALAPRPGRAGDFLTAPETHPIYGAALARGLDEIWRRLGEPDRFVIREFGAGTGVLAEAIVDRLERDGSGLASALRYEPVEVEPRRVLAFRERFQGRGWADHVLEHDPGRPVVGAIIGNEMLDALPTHRVVAREGRLLEVLVGWADGAFVDVEAEPTPGLAERLADEGIELADGQHGEVCLVLDGWMASAVDRLERGVLLLIDYGYPAAELYDPVRRRRGTLRAYVRQRAHDDPYRHVGRQDLTTHVDVTAVEAAAAHAGLTHLGTTTQAAFLMGLGIEGLLREIQGDPKTTMEEYLALRSSVMRLLDPAATGRFRVMGFARDWPDGPPLSGFAYQMPRR